MNIHLEDRALLGLKGRDKEAFLQSTITQDITLLNSQKAIYSAHLTTKGKFLFDFFVADMDDMYVIDCHKDELMPLAQSLHQYVITKDVEFHDLTGDYHLTVSDKAIENSALSYPDPRHKDLGWRNWLSQKPEKSAPMADYTQKRIDLKIIDGAYDAVKEKTLINELGFESLNGVSFNKGCYVGQELTARTKFRTEPKKKIVQVTLESDETVERGSVILCGNMDAGWLFSNQNGTGLALIRTRYLEKDLTLAGKPLHITA